MSKHTFLIIISLFLLIITGCSPVDTNEKYENIPEPGESTGVIYGTLLNPEKEPINESIFLSQNITYSEPNLPATVSFSYQSDPKGELNYENGVFYFSNIEPAENYVITIFTGSGAPIVVKEENSDEPLMIEVSAGEALNLGELIIDIQH